jgi:hypothetical protein
MQIGSNVILGVKSKKYVERAPVNRTGIITLLTTWPLPSKSSSQLVGGDSDSTGLSPNELFKGGYAHRP